MPERTVPAYLEAQAQGGAAFNAPAGWARMSILNIARMGKFSSDRTVGEYARDIWGLKSVEVPRAPRQWLSTDEQFSSTGVDFP
jgi:hypothetical protein